MTTPLYINTCFENGSPMFWEEVENGLLVFQPLHDHERGSANRQLTHWHFRLHGTTGQEICLRIPPTQNVYGGRHVNAFEKRIGNQMSVDGINWRSFFFYRQDDGSMEAHIVMPAETVTVARIQPYTTRDLASLLYRIQDADEVSVEMIGQTVEKRPLEMITLRRGGDSKPGILLRGRAHPWESGGNWFLDGVIACALEDPTILDTIGLYILPMAAKDGVVHGHTRFNVNGFDLNRGFGSDRPFDENLVPENAALIRWTENMARKDILPRFAMDLHNDSWGKLHVGDMERDSGFAERIRLLDKCMRRDTYYTEGMTTGAGSTTFGEGMRNLFGIDSVVCELNSTWLAGADAVPDAKLWNTYGRQFAGVLRDFVCKVYK